MVRNYILYIVGSSYQWDSGEATTIFVVKNNKLFTKNLLKSIENFLEIVYYNACKEIIVEKGIDSYGKY